MTTTIPLNEANYENCLKKRFTIKFKTKFCLVFERSGIAVGVASNAQSTQMRINLRASRFHNFLGTCLADTALATRALIYFPFAVALVYFRVADKKVLATSLSGKCFCMLGLHVAVSLVSTNKTLNERILGHYDK